MCASDRRPKTDLEKRSCAANEAPIFGFHVHGVFNGADPIQSETALKVHASYIQYLNSSSNLDGKLEMCQFEHPDCYANGQKEICVFPTFPGIGPDAGFPYFADPIFSAANFAFYIPRDRLLEAEIWWRQNHNGIPYVLHACSGCETPDHSTWAQTSEGYSFPPIDVSALDCCQDGPPGCYCGFSQYKSSAGKCLGVNPKTSDVEYMECPKEIFPFDPSFAYMSTVFKETKYTSAFVQQELAGNGWFRTNMCLAVKSCDIGGKLFSTDCAADVDEGLTRFRSVAEGVLGVDDCPGMCIDVANGSLALSACDMSLRIRREVRSIPDEELFAFRDAMYTLRDTSYEEGQQLYGPAFLPLSHFAMMHAIVVLDPRGNQGHSNFSPDQSQPCFLTFHRAWLLRMEQALLSVRPDMRALPFWDPRLDTSKNNWGSTDPLHGAGKYYQDPEKYIFSDKYGGPQSGESSLNFQVTRGLFANWTVIRTPPESETPEKAWAIFKGDKNGYMRNHNSSTKYLQRYPTNHVFNQSIPGDDMSKLVQHWPSEAELTTDLILTEGMYNNCLERKTWNDWMRCMDFGTYETEGLCPKGQTALSTVRGKCQQPWWHSQVHFKCGSQSKAASDYGTMDSDFMDIATSPNEPFFFSLFHAGIDRHFLRWQQKTLKENQNMVKNFWGYDDVPNKNPGCNLDDVVNSNYPFIESPFKHPPKAPSKGYTHREVLELTSPGLHQIYDYSYDHEYLN